MLTIPDVLDRAEVETIRARLATAAWTDGNATSGHQSARAKRNRQLPEDGDDARQLGAMVLDALGRSPLFVAAGLPLKVFPPLFSRYEAGDAFDHHVDAAIRIQRGSDFRIRSDLSATLFLSDPASYDGGELIVEGGVPAKLHAGDMLLYSASTIHRVAPITRGARLACFFWVQSMVRDDAARGLLLDLDRSIQELADAVNPASPPLVRLTGLYHNLLRRWAEL